MSSFLKSYNDSNNETFKRVNKVLIGSYGFKDIEEIFDFFGSISACPQIRHRDVIGDIYSLADLITERVGDTLPKDKEEFKREMINQLKNVIGITTINKTIQFPIKETRQTRVDDFLINSKFFKDVDEIDEAVEELFNRFSQDLGVTDEDFYECIDELVMDVNITGEFDKEELMDYVEYTITLKLEEQGEDID